MKDSKWRKHFPLAALSYLTVLSVFPLTESARAGGGGGSRSGGGGFGRSSSSGSSSWGSSSPSSSSNRNTGSSGSRYTSNSGSFGSPSSGMSSSGNRFGSSSPSGTGGTANRFGSSSPSGAGSSPSRFGSSNPSGSGSRVAAPAAVGAGSSKWGSSAPSGGSARANYAAAGPSATRSASNRPAANAPAPSQHMQAQPVYNTRTTVINNYGSRGGFGGGGGFGTGSLLLAGAGGMVGGYLLGHAIASSVYRDSHGCCYGCGCGYYGPPPPWYYDSYVPYRYRYANDPNSGTSTSNTGSSATANPASGTTTLAPLPNKPIEVCTLARWNMELPFTEMPNMMLTFLASDNISGNALDDKARFLYQFINSTAEPYGTLPSSANVFQIDSSFNLQTCNFQIPRNAKEHSSSEFSNSSVANATSTSGDRPWFAGALMAEWRRMVQHGDRTPCITASYANIPECTGGATTGPEEPFITAVKRLEELYSNVSTDSTMLNEVVQSAKKCYPKDITPPRDIIPCLDYSIDSRQVSALENQKSIFGNEEVCSKYLNPDISKCFKEGSTFPCSVSDLTNLNVFARNYYLCKDPVDPQLMARLQTGSRSGPLQGDAVPQVPPTQAPSRSGINGVIPYVPSSSSGSSSSRQHSNGGRKEDFAALTGFASSLLLVIAKARLFR